MSGLNEKNKAGSLKVAKTIKLFIGGDFPRTESGRSLPLYSYKTKNIYAHICRASRKDVRNAVTAAQSALHGWQSKSAYNRGQILYRMAEMMEARRSELIETMAATLGTKALAANKSVDAAIDAFVYYAGFADKFQQVMGSVNPVSGPHHNFTTTEAVGVVALIGDQKFNFEKLVSQLAAIIASGNVVVALMGFEGSALLAPLAELLSTSDLSKGVVNLLTGDVEELAPHFATHMEIQSLSYQGSDKKLLKEFQLNAGLNMKRLVPKITKDLSLEHLTHYVEFKTVWHPIGN